MPPIKRYKLSARSAVSEPKRTYKPDRDVIPSPGYKKTSTMGGYKLERVKGFEPSTSTLARLRSTPELRPHHQNEIFNTI